MVLLKVVILKILKLWLPPALWAGLIFYLSSTVPGSVSGPPWIDFIIKKSGHMLLYAVLWILLYRATHRPYLSLLFAISYSLSDEYHQSFVPGRHPAVMDVGFDALGGTIALWAQKSFLPKAPKKLKKLAENLEIL